MIPQLSSEYKFLQAIMAVKGGVRLIYSGCVHVCTHVCTIYAVYYVHVMYMPNWLPYVCYMH